MKKRFLTYTLCLLTALILSSRRGLTQGDSLFWFTGSEVQHAYALVVERDQAMERIDSLQAEIRIQDSSFYYCEEGNIELIQMIVALRQADNLNDQRIDGLQVIIDNKDKNIRRQRRGKWFFIGTTVLAVALGLLGGT